LNLIPYIYLRSYIYKKNLKYILQIEKKSSLIDILNTKNII
jgi:hypothetical protein